MDENSQVVVYPVTGMLGIALVVLKLCGIINWSWWWVTIPFWGPLVLAFSLVLVLLLMSLVVD